MPSASTSSPASRSPAVSAKVTGTPPSSSRASTTSRVVPARAETIAASRPTSAFNREDFPAFGAPRIATTTPSRNRSPRPASARCALISAASAVAATPTASSNPAGKSSSSNSMKASCRASNAVSRAAQPPYSLASAPSAWRSAWRRCPAVSAATRSTIPSAAVRSSLPCRKARRVNSPGSAGRAPAVTRASATPATTAGPPCRWNSALSSPV